MAEKSLKQPEILRSSFSAGSDATFDNVCQPCSGDDKNLEAVGFCVDCSELLCDDCYTYHQKPTITRHHKLLDIETAKTDTSFTTRLNICTEKCSEHSGKAIEYFCKDHGYLGCGVCITMDHRNCKGVQYIPKIAKDTCKGKELSSLIGQLDMVLLQTKILADTSRGNKLKSQDTFDKASVHVKQVRKEVNETLNILETEIEEEAEKIKIKDMQKMDDNINACNKIQRKAENIKLNMSEMLKKEQYCNLFVAMKTNSIELRSVLKPLDDISSDNFISDYQFQSDEQLANFVHVGSIGTLCKKDVVKTNARKVGEISGARTVIPEKLYYRIGYDHEGETGGC